MFVVCWHYCIPFFKFLVLAFGPILFMIAGFMMWRAVLYRRLLLAKTAMYIVALAFLKVAFLDYRWAMENLLCADGICNRSFRIGIQASSIAVMGALGYAWMRLWQMFIVGRLVCVPRLSSLKRLRGFLSLSTVSVVSFAIWAVAPFTTMMATGGIPDFILYFSWHYFAIFSGVSLGVTYWFLEEYHAYSNLIAREKTVFKKKVWAPKDTFWTLVFVYAVTAFLGFAASEMLTEAQTALAG